MSDNSIGLVERSTRYQPAARPQAAPDVSFAVDARGLVKRYGDTTALDGIDLRVPVGTVTAVLGP
ncbi:MAG TPA: hypothetical protein VM942_09845, partial [Acidimicrobiales bacterium]|nr:hypothetical protein [Acidimicrobiales bacterium]